MYLSGHVREGWPAMLTPFMGNRPPADQPWAADTGCFAHPELHDDGRYLAWLEALPRERGLFATAPDRFGAAEATLEVALPMLPRIRALVPAALVAQPELQLRQVPWDEFDVLFVGGPDAWQHSEACAELIHEAVRRGVPVHIGRVNGWRRLNWAARMGASSADGTFLRYAPDGNELRLRRWLVRLDREPHLELRPW